MKPDPLDDEPLALPKRAKWRAAVTWSLIGGTALALAVAGIVFATDPNAMFSVKAASAGGERSDAKASGLIGAASLDPKDPALHFSQTHVGQVIFTAANSDNCRRVLFDNRTGTSYWVNDVDCARPAEQATVSDKPDRLLALKKSFNR
jgi:hypothetical protein